MRRWRWCPLCSSLLFMMLSHWNKSLWIDMSPHSGHIILIPSQPVFALSPSCYVLSGEATNTNFIVFGLTRLETSEVTFTPTMRLIDWFIVFNATFSYIMATSFSGGRSWSTRREPSTMGKQLVNFNTRDFESSASFFQFTKLGTNSRCIGERLVWVVR
jgi:hypothetical protein